MTEDTLPEQIKEHYNKAQLAIDRKNYNYAIELLASAINIKPDFAKGRQLLRLTEIKKFREKPPNILTRIIIRVFSFIPLLAAMISETKSDYHNAMSIYEKILKNDPMNGTVMVKLGNLLKIEGMEESAAVTLESAVDVSPKNVTAYELLGEIYSNSKNYDRAGNCFKKVLELKPRDAAAERGLRNLDALTTIDKSFEKKSNGGFKIREIRE